MSAVYHFSKETPPESMHSDITALNKFPDEAFMTIVTLMLEYLEEPAKSGRLMSQLDEFAEQYGVNVSGLKNVVRSVLTMTNGALRKNLSPDQVKEDLQHLGLSDEKADSFAEQTHELIFEGGRGISWISLPVPEVEDSKVGRFSIQKQFLSDFSEPVLPDSLSQTLNWKMHLVSLSRSSLGQTLRVNQLLDMDWKFGVTAASSDLDTVGNTFLQMKLVIDKGNNIRSNVYMELTLSQFYSFLHEMEKAKASLEYFS